MAIISSGDLALLRGEDHRLEIYASILIPRNLWAARVNNASIARGDTSIAWDGGSGSHWAAVETFQEVWVGTAAGLDDIGRVRIKGVSSGDSGATGTLTASPNSLIWVDDAYLTFKHDYPLLPKFPFIEEDGTFKKDGDVAYTDENGQPSPVCIAGNHRAKKLSGGTAVFNVDLTDSYAIANGASISSYSVSTYPSTGVTVDVTAGVGDITFTVAGQYWVKFTCTDSNGKSQSTFRSYWVEAADLSTVFTGFNLSQMTGDWDRGGWECGINVANSATLAEIPDRALVVIWGDWWFGDTNSPITLLPDDDNAIMVGYVRKYQQNPDLESGEYKVDFQITTVESLLRQKFDYSVSLEAVPGTPSKWYEYEDWLTVGRALHHLYKHHSTLFEVADFRGLMDDTTLRAYAEMEDGTLYSMGDTLSRVRGTRQHIVCDRGGILRLAYERQLLPDTPRGSLPEVAELLKTDRSGLLTLVGEPEKRTAFVHVSGFSWDGTFTDGKPNANALCAISPGNKPHDDGPSPNDTPKQTFTGQTQANQIAGRVDASENNPVREVRTSLHGNYLGVMEPCRAEYWKMSLLSTETPRGIVWADKKLFLFSVTAQFDHKAGRVAITSIFEPEADGNDGIPTTCPTFPDFGGDFTLPDYTDLGGALATASSFDYLPPTLKAWTQKTAEATSHAYQDPFWSVTQDSFASKDAIIWRCGVGYIKRSVDGGDNWTAVTPASDPPNDAGDSPAPVVGDVEFVQGEGSYITDQTHFFIARWQNASDEWRSWCLLTDDDGATWTWLGLSGGTSTLSIEDYPASATVVHADYPQVVDMGNDRVVLVFMGESQSQWRLIDTVNGTVLDIDGSGGSLFATFSVVAKLTSTTFVLIEDEADIYDFKAYIVSIFGDEFTWLADTIIHGQATGTGDYMPTRASVARLSDTKFLTVYNRNVDGDPYLTGVVGEFNGVDDVSYGTPVTIHNELTTYFLLLEGVLGTHLYYQDDSLSSLRGIMLTTSGSVLTVNSSFEIVENDVSYIAACLVNGDKAVVFYSDSGNSDFVYARVITLGESSSTLGTDYLIKAASVTATYATATGTDAALLAYRYGTNTLAYIRVSVSGHTLSVGGETLYPFDGRVPIVIQLDAGLMYIAANEDDSRKIKIAIPGTGATKALGATVGKALSETAYVTLWADSGELILSVIDLATMGQTYIYSLGGATEEQLDAKTFVAYPYCPFALGDEYLYVYGRMSIGGLGTCQVIYSEDGGASFAAVETGWDADHCGSLLEDFGTVFAIRNVVGLAAKLYIGDYTALSVVSTLLGNAGVNPSSMAYDWFNNVVYVGLDTGAAVMVLRANAPFTEWVDITYDHQTSNGINAIMVL